MEPLVIYREAVVFPFPFSPKFSPFVFPFNVHKWDLSIQSTSGITQVNSVSGWIFAPGLRQWAQHEGKGLKYCLLFCSVLIYSLSFSFLYTLHQHAPPECTNLHLPWPLGSYVWKSPTGEASERAAEKGREDMRRGSHAHVHLQCLMNDGDNDWWYLGGLGENTWVVLSNTHTHTETHSCTSTHGPVALTWLLLR